MSAASAQSRTGVLLLVLSITLLVVGVQWLVISPREPETVDLVGRSDFAHWDTSIPTPVLDELQWWVPWQPLQSFFTWAVPGQDGWE